jgi:hypothetical protein
MPVSLAERAALWRTRLTGRRLLIVLDDVADREQVRHLLPATHGCACILTASRRIIDLAGVHWLKVDVLAADDAFELLGTVAGMRRVHADPGSSARLVAACSYQPLAVRIAAARLLDRPLWTVVQIAAQLDDDLRQPVVMHEDCKVVDAPFRAAQARLSEEQAAAFRLLAVPNCAQVTAASAAAILEIPEVGAKALLEGLVDAHLMVLGPSESYRYHGLIKAFARRRATTQDGPERCQAALRSLLDHYLRTAQHAASALRGEEVPSFGAPQQARAWLAEAQNDVLAVLDQTEGVPDLAVHELVSLLPVS